MPHACDGARARTPDMLNMDAVFQLPMFWLNADAARNACRADPTPSTAQRTKHSAPYIALPNTRIQQVMLHRTASWRQVTVYR